MQAPSGSPSDVSSRLLDICDVVDACEGLSIEAVISAAAENLARPAGKHWLVANSQGLPTVWHAISMSSPVVWTTLVL